MIVNQEGKPTIGFWVFPDNQSPGMLEDFARLLIRESDTLWGRAVEFVDGIPVNERRFIPNQYAKACMKTWLAWQEDPGLPNGYAIKRGCLDHEGPIAVALKDWLVALFELKAQVSVI